MCCFLPQEGSKEKERKTEEEGKRDREIGRARVGERERERQRECERATKRQKQRQKDRRETETEKDEEKDGKRPRQRHGERQTEMETDTERQLYREIRDRERQREKWQPGTCRASAPGRRQRNPLPGTQAVDSVAGRVTSLKGTGRGCKAGFQPAQSASTLLVQHAVTHPGTDPGGATAHPAPVVNTGALQSPAFWGQRTRGL